MNFDFNSCLFYLGSGHFVHPEYPQRYLRSKLRKGPQQMESPLQPHKNGKDLQGFAGCHVSFKIFEAFNIFYPFLLNNCEDCKFCYGSDPLLLVLMGSRVSPGLEFL